MDGKEPDHKASQRLMVPADKVDTFIDCKPKEACDCGGIIVLNDKIHIHQVFDIPLAKYAWNARSIVTCCINSIIKVE